MTLRLGLTGSIGMGKSTTAAMFAAEGIPVWDADAAVHRLYDVGGAGVSAIAEIFPDVIVDGTVSRPALKKHIAADPAVLTAIENVVHPLVAADRASFLAAHDDAPIVVLDIPLLFETGGVKLVDHILVVSVSADVQRARVLARPNMTEAQFDAIVARQVPDAEKRRRADTVIETLTLDDTRNAVRNLLKQLQGQKHA